MELEYGKFTILNPDHSAEAYTLEKDALVIGRLKSSDVVLNHRSVSRVHAGINRVGSEYVLINLSTSNSLTLNGKLLASEKVDVLADGDIIQVGPFTIAFARHENELALTVRHQFTGDLANTSQKLPSISQIMPDRGNQEVADVLKVFWEKRTRDKEDWGTRLRPKAKPQPGKALINWKPTADLQGTWRGGLFVWAFLIVGALAVAAFYGYPQIYAGKPLSNPHMRETSSTAIAVRANQNSCTTCHARSEPMENSCIKCHRAEQFHPSNTRAHELAGVTCTVCHVEHQGEDYLLREAAIRGCAECHNDANKTVYNGKTVGTAHDGTFNYPVKSGGWTWNGPYREIAESIPALKLSAAGETEQQRLSREFHAIHVFRLILPEGMNGDAANRVSCSTCHNSFDPVDRETPRQTCAKCHNGLTDKATGRVVINSNEANCISCHVQHPFSQNRWSSFLTEKPLADRRNAIEAQILRLREP